MTKKPEHDVDWVSLRPADFFADNQFAHWDCRLCGAYICLILRLYTSKGRLENNPVELQKLAQWRGEGWGAAWLKLERKFYRRGKYIFHRRVTSELRNARKRRQSAVAAGLASGKARQRPFNARSTSVEPSNVMLSNVIKNTEKSAKPKISEHLQAHIFQIYGHARQWEGVGEIQDAESRIPWQIRDALKTRSVEFLLALSHKDFVSGWKAYQGHKIIKPDTKFALIYAINAGKNRLRQEEEHQEVVRKAEIEKEEAEAKGPAIALAAKLAEDKQADDIKRDAWWGGLDMTSRRKLWQDHKKLYGYAISTKSTVRAWAWEEYKKERKMT